MGKVFRTPQDAPLRKTVVGPSEMPAVKKAAGGQRTKPDPIEAPSTISMTVTKVSKS